MDEAELPTGDQLDAGIRAFAAKERGAGVYYEALRLVSSRWGRPDGMADGVKILLDSWHQAFYRSVVSIYLS